MVTFEESLFVKSSYLTHWKVYWPLPVLMLQLWGLLSVRVLNNFFAWFWYSRILLERWPMESIRNYARLLYFLVL